MALLGFQLCFTLIAATFLQKVFPIISLGRWILCNGSLYRFLHPNNDDLKKVAGKETTEKRGNKKDNKTRKRKQSDKATVENSSNQTFKIPKNADIVLTTTNLTVDDVITLEKYDEFEWLMNYCLCTTMVYVGTELYMELWRPYRELNYSMIWIGLALGFVCKSLFAIMRLYFKTESGELATCITFGCFSFVAAMGALAVDADILEFGIDSAYDDFAKNSTLLSFNTVYPTPAPNPVSLPILKVCIALIGGIMATLLAFPGIRTAQMYIDGLKYSRKNKLVTLLLHVSFGTPFVICLMWVKPFARDVLCSVPAYASVGRKPFLTDYQFDINRIICIILLCILKLVAIRYHLQAYLNLGHLKLRRLRREAGHMTNIEVQRTVARVFFYLCVVALQYVGPVLAVISLTACMKSMGGHSWSQVWTDYSENNSTATFDHPTLNIITEESSYSEVISNARVSLARLSAVFTPALFNSVFSFFIWWLCTIWSVASALGIVYHRYLTIV